MTCALCDASGNFDARPARGVLDKGAFCLVALRFAPTVAASTRRTLRCVLNGQAATTLQLQLHGQGEKAAVELADGGELYLSGCLCYCCYSSWEKAAVELADVAELYFRKTCVGVSSSSNHAIINRARIPLVYEVLIPKWYAEELSVDQPAVVYITLVNWRKIEELNSGNNTSRFFKDENNNQSAR
ncbi:hypothetical protein T492DRAFT_847550 [Pavlovales sp. CCMP2436]|nr:hypothetical protein T492DRAFT_847550 [Pavlovales sp. CCMP2436]